MADSLKRAIIKQNVIGTSIKVTTDMGKIFVYIYFNENNGFQLNDGMSTFHDALITALG